MVERIEDRIRECVEKNRVVIYMKGTPSFPMCGYSAEAVDLFNQLGVPYEAVDVLTEPEVRDGIRKMAPQVFIHFLRNHFYPLQRLSKESGSREPGFAQALQGLVR